MRSKLRFVEREKIGSRRNSVLGREVNLSMKDCYKLICFGMHVKFGDSPLIMSKHFRVCRTMVKGFTFLKFLFINYMK